MKKDLFLISGASTGIGNALALHFAGLGHHVLAGVRSQKDFDGFKDVGNVEAIILDVQKSADLERIPALLEKQIGSYRKLVLINNAGIAVNGPWEIVPEGDIKKQFEINVFGTIFLTQKCLPTLRKTKGHVFNISSVSGLFAAPFLGPYATSKFAVEAFSDSLRREMFHFGVGVTSINPGPIQTPIWNKGLDNPQNAAFQKDPVYGKILKKFQQGVVKVVEAALPVQAVIDVVDEAYNSTPPPARKVVATLSTKTFFGLAKTLPVQMVDRLLKRF